MSTNSPAKENPLLSAVRQDIPGRFNEIDLLKRQWPRITNTLLGNILPPYEVLIHPSSACNLCCVWCIGDHVPIQGTNREGLPIFLDASKNNSQRLPDYLADPANMLKVVEGIVDYKKTGTYSLNGEQFTEEFKVENVSFSGLIGEPLVSKKAVLMAMQFLVAHGLRVGIFTNGVLMDEDTVDTILQIAYVHLSLDAGTGETYGRLKFGGRPDGPARFHKALRNLGNVVRKRDDSSGSNLAINASFILYPENYKEVLTAARILKDIGVEYLRVKRDISGERLLNPIQKQETMDLLSRVRAELVDDRFKLVEIHKLDAPDETSRVFSKCFITDLMAAIGSDGQLYPCNYHPRPGGAAYGSAIESSFEEVWEGSQRRATKKGLPHICPAMCDPFKNRSNKLLNVVNDLYEADGLMQLESYKNSM